MESRKLIVRMKVGFTQIPMGQSPKAIRGLRDLMGTDLKTAHDLVKEVLVKRQEFVRFHTEPMPLTRFASSITQLEEAGFSITEALDS